MQQRSEARRLFAEHPEADLCTLEPWRGRLHLKSSAWLRPLGGLFFARARLEDDRACSWHRADRGGPEYRAFVASLAEKVVFAAQLRKQTRWGWHARWVEARRFLRATFTPPVPTLKMFFSRPW